MDTFISVNLTIRYTGTECLLESVNKSIRWGRFTATHQIKSPHTPGDRKCNPITLKTAGPARRAVRNEPRWKEG